MSEPINFRAGIQDPMSFEGIADLFAHFEKKPRLATIMTNDVARFLSQIGVHFHERLGQCTMSFGNIMVLHDPFMPPGMAYALDQFGKVYFSNGKVLIFDYRTPAEKRTMDKRSRMYSRVDFEKKLCPQCGCIAQLYDRPVALIPFPKCLACVINPEREYQHQEQVCEQWQNRDQLDAFRYALSTLRPTGFINQYVKGTS